MNTLAKLLSVMLTVGMLAVVGCERKDSGTAPPTGTGTGTGAGTPTTTPPPPADVPPPAPK